MKKDYIVNLNTIPVRFAICCILSKVVHIDYEVKHIKFGSTKTKHGLWIKNKFVLYWDRHMHCPSKMQHISAIFEFLEAVKQTCKNYPMHKQKPKPKIKRNVVGASYKRALEAIENGPVNRKFPIITRRKK